MSRQVDRGLTLVALVFLLGCATVPSVVPLALIDARAALAAAKNTKANVLVFEDFQEAWRLLKQAEDAFASEQKIGRVENMAFAARSHAEIAEARARTRLAEEAYKTEQQNLIDQRNLLMALDHKARELKEAKQKMKRAEAGRVATEAKAAAEARKTETDKRLRRELEIILLEAGKIKNAQAKIESQSLVITLSGKVLFTSGSSQFHRSASRVLNQVAGLLKDNPDYHARIEGYTDGTGDHLLNNLLSQARAESVTNYLTQQNISLDRLKAVGLGPGNPVATNDTAAGRNLNHRVEIILEKKTETTTEP